MGLGEINSAKWRVILEGRIFLKKCQSKPFPQATTIAHHWFRSVSRVLRNAKSTSAHPAA